MAVLPFTLPLRTWKDYPDPESLLTYKEYGESLFDVLDFLYNPPMVHLAQTTTQSQASGSWTVYNWQEERIDTHAMHSTTNPSRIYPKYPGWYKGWYGVSWAGTGGIHGNGKRHMEVTSTVEGKSGGRHDFRPTSNGDVVVKGKEFFLPSPGDGVDYFTVRTWQNAGSAMNTKVDADEFRPEFYMRWWAPL